MSKTNEAYHILAPWLNLIILIDATKENLELIMEDYISLYVKELVH
jgi:hypothetical protein